MKKIVIACGMISLLVGCIQMPEQAIIDDDQTNTVAAFGVGLYKWDYNTQYWVSINNWDLSFGTPVRISVGQAGNPWVVTSKGYLVCPNNNGGWRDRKVPGQVQDVGVNNGVVVTRTDDKLFKYNYNYDKWDSIPLGRAKRVDVDIDGNVWCVNGQGQLWKWNGSSWWRDVRISNVSDVGCGPTSGILVVALNDGSVKKLKDNNWKPVDGQKIASIDIAENSNLWGVYQSSTYKFASGRWHYGHAIAALDVGCSSVVPSIWITSTYW